ncbi:MAG: exonuclease domain-containing protein [Lachnospiraceae bacterium]|nr:exonuclease domain-containing protein [Lachnospiraceae bacterium]
MNYIVFDLEWNQSARGKAGSNKKLPFEIIEIGAVKLDENLREIGRFHELVKPKVYRDMSRIIGGIVHMNMDDLKEAESFSKVARHFLSFCGKNYIFCTWGNQDITELQSNMQFFHVPPLGRGPIRYLDVQKLFSLEREGKKHQYSLEYAVDEFHINKTVPFHRALDDAYYTSRVLEKLARANLTLYSFDTFRAPKSRKEEIRIMFPTYYKYISRTFRNKGEALKDKDVRTGGCYLCEKKTTPVVEQFTPNGKYYLSVHRCAEHGLIKSKIRVKKDSTKKTFVIKTMRQISEEELTPIMEKAEKVKLAMAKKSE